MKVGDIYVTNAIRNLPKQIILRSMKELPTEISKYQINMTYAIMINREL